MTQPTASQSILYKAHRVFFYLGLFYVACIALLAIPSVQRHAAYQHSLKFPLFANFSIPEKYGLAPGRTLNFHVTTSDNETLGAWFILSDSAHHVRSQEAFSPSRMKETIAYALQNSPTILFLHGAAGTRAVPWRVDAYSAFTSRLACNVLVIDYRGFADSTGVPSQEGTVQDSYAGWNWLLGHGAKAEDILIVGHSLGTGVASQFVSRLAEDRSSGKTVNPRGVVLLVPFSSLSTLIETYSIFHLPILQPLQMFPLGIKLLKRLLNNEFDTLATISKFHVPTLIVHSQSDAEIPHAHGVTLLDELLSPQLPPAQSLPSAPGSPNLKEELAAFTRAQDDRKAVRSALVQKREIPGFGFIEEFDRDGKDGRGERRVVYLETFWGSHAHIALQEGVQDEMARTFKLGAYAN